ncbi:dipeptidase PepV [Hydrogenophaga sp. T4]|nr:dipeptidase PepV [Hydrogenophaga sp. T4]
MNARLPQPLPPLDPLALQAQVDTAWTQRIVPELVRYIEVPAKSPMFDPEWARNGLLERVLQSAADWVRAQAVVGLTLEIVRLNDANGVPRTPVLFFEVPASAGKDGTPAPASGQTVLMYGHLDKQPEFTGWRSDLGPWTPKIDDGKLYGRGGADDGYAVYASIAAVQALKDQGVAHPRIVGLIETCEESGSADLLPYVDALRTGWATWAW